MKRITVLGLTQMEASVMIVCSDHGRMKVALAEIESELDNATVNYPFCLRMRPKGK